MYTKLRALILFFSLSLLTLEGFSQNLERYNWYFGSSNQAIRFNRTSRVATITTKAIPFGPAGNATGSDPANANLLFYTDGKLVYDASHVQMPSGSGLSGNTLSNQPVAICPVPGQANKYFVFTSTASFNIGGSINVSVIDMTISGNSFFPAPPLGNLTTKNQAVPGLTNRSEAMIIVPHSNGTDFWLITHAVNSSNYSATLINAASFTGTYVTTTASNLSPIPLLAGNFSYHAGKGKIAVSAQDTNTDAIILNFNATSGAITFDKNIPNSGVATATNQSIYDIEWSVNGNFLYLSRYGEPGVTANVLQFDYNNPTTTLTSVLPATVFRSFGLQMAPDSSIYHLYQLSAAGPTLVGKISRTDSIASKVQYKAAQLTSTSFGGTQFPSFSPKSKITLTVDFTSIGNCENSNTTFFPDVKPGADSLNWDFGDMSPVVNDWSPVYKYKQPQSFNVKLTAFYQGETQSVTKAVLIKAFPLKIQMTQDTTACSCELKFPKDKTIAPCGRTFKVTAKVSGGGTPSYAWSNGTTGPTLTVDSAGYYYVVVTDGSGCSGYAGVNVKEYGQQDQRANIWYFGNKAGIDFNENPPVALTNSAMTAPAGCAIICDRNGQAIFYTDGSNVYNKKNVLITVTGIGGDPTASQSSIIVPVPGDETLYYIFTNESTNSGSSNTVRYSLFDLKLNSGTGAIVTQNVALFSKGTERITASGKWLIIHEWGNNTFRTYQISGAGIGDPVLTAIGSDHSFNVTNSGTGYMKLGPNNNLAVALPQSGANLVELFHLNDSTGKITNYRKIDLKDNSGQVYGVEFSPGGNKLFASLKAGGTSKIFEYSIDSLSKPHFKKSTPQPGEIGALQIAPDGQIYAAINGSTFVGTIQAVEDTTQVTTINFSSNNFPLKGPISQLGLPNFIQQISSAIGSPGFTFTGICFGDSTKFVGTATDQIDQFTWTFGDGLSKPISFEPNAAHLYAAAGTYNVTMQLSNRCPTVFAPIIKPVTIFNPPAKPTIPLTDVLCNGPVILNANKNNVAGLTYLWSDLTTVNPHAPITEQSIVSVKATDVHGCSASAQTLIADNRPQVDLGPDQTICQNTILAPLDPHNPAFNITWTVDGIDVYTGPSRTQAVSTTVNGVHTYKAVVVDPVTTCATATDQTNFTINPSPTFTIGLGSNPSACNVADGVLALNITATTPASGPYSYFAVGPTAIPSAVDQAAPLSTTFPGLKAGTYSVIVVDQISTCQISQSFGLSDAPFTATATPLAPNCDPVTMQVTIASPPAPAFPVSYTVTPSGTGTSVGPTGGIGTLIFNTAPLAAGNYTIQITDNTGCIFAFPKGVSPSPPVPITITPASCNTPPTITAAGATTYTWTGGPATGAGSISGGAGTATVQLTPGIGSFVYTVVASNGTCPNTQTVNVTLDNPSVNFTQSNACAANVILTATPAAGYTYRWYKSGVFQPTLLGRTVSVGVSENGASYQAEVFNTLNGCGYKSAPKTIQVLGSVDAFLRATPACDDNKPFTLTASTTDATGVSYAWFKNNVAIAGQTTPSISQTDVGTYRVEISKGGGVCKAIATASIIRSPLPVGKLPNRLIICNDPENKDPLTNQADLDPGKFASYSWFKNELTLNYTQQVYTATSQGKYRVDITNSFGCVAPDETEIKNECIPKIEAPNAFRPGSTLTENNDFYVFSFFIKDDNFQVFLYNRWGELVYTSSDRHFKWNGGFNNSASQPLPGGSYAYIIRYVSAFHPERGVLEKRGGVALLR